MLQPTPVPTDLANRVPIWLSGAQCSGGEATLAQCPGADLDPDLDQTCSHFRDATVVCYNATDSDSGALHTVQISYAIGYLMHVGGRTVARCQAGLMPVW